MKSKNKEALKKFTDICKDVADRLDAGTLDDAGAVDILRPAIFELRASGGEARQAGVACPEMARLAESSFGTRLLSDEGEGVARLRELSKKEKP